MNPMADASTIEQALMMHARMQKTPINGSLELLPLCNLNCKMCYVRLSKAEIAYLKGEKSSANKKGE